jgi:hypothetical protein
MLVVHLIAWYLWQSGYLARLVCSFNSTIVLSLNDIVIHIHDPECFSEL